VIEYDRASLGQSGSRKHGRANPVNRVAVLSPFKASHTLGRGHRPGVQERSENDFLRLFSTQQQLVLEAFRKHLVGIGFEVEAGKSRDEKVCVPVLFGRDGAAEKSFDADAYHRAGGFVLEVEAGRGVVNNQFLKDLFQACMMHEVKYLAIAIRKVYRGDKNFETVCRFFDTLYASNRLTLPLEGILVIGY